MARKSFALTSLLMFLLSSATFSQAGLLMAIGEEAACVIAQRAAGIVVTSASVAESAVATSLNLAATEGVRRLTTSPNAYPSYPSAKSNLFGHNIYWNEGSLSFDEQSLLRLYRLCLKRQLITPPGANKYELNILRYTYKTPTPPDEGLPDLLPESNHNDDRLRPENKNEADLISDARISPRIHAAYIEHYKKLIADDRRAFLKASTIKFSAMPFPVVKAIPASQRARTLYRKDGFKTYLGVWSDKTLVNAPGKNLYVEIINEKNAQAAIDHHSFITDVAPKLGKYKAPVNSFNVINGYLHMFYLDGERQVSSFVHVKNKNLTNYITAFTELSEAHTLNFIIGDNKRVTRMINAAFDERGFDCYTRRRNVKTDLTFPDKINRLHELKGRPLNMASTTIVNGLPRDGDIAWKQGYAPSDHADILQMHSNINNWFASANINMHTKQGFLDELQHGSNDVVVAFAHADGNAIYINNEKITLIEFEQMKQRNIVSSKPRVIILLACNTGNIFGKKGWIFKKDIKSIAQVFIEKGFADYVIAPDEEIVNANIEAFVNKLLSGMNLGDLSQLGHFKKISASIMGKPVKIAIYYKGNSSFSKNINS